MKENTDLYAMIVGALAQVMKGVKKKFSLRNFILGIISGGLLGWATFGLLMFFGTEFPLSVIILIAWSGGWVANEFHDMLDKFIQDAYEILKSYAKRKSDTTKIITALIISTTLISCGTTKETNEKHIEHVTETYKDSVYHTKTELLDTNWIQSSIASGSIKLEILKALGEFKIDNERAHTTVIYNRDTGDIDISTTCDSAFQVYIKTTIEDFSSKILSDVNETIESQLTSKVVKGGFWQDLKWFFIGLLTMAIVVLVYWIYRKYLKQFIPWKRSM